LTFEAFDFNPRTRVLFGAGRLGELGAAARAQGFRRALLAADRGVVAAGHAGRAARLLEEACVEVAPFHDFGSNPDSEAVERGRAFAARLEVDSVIAVGGGSSLDFAKGVNFLLTNGGRVRDYRGYGRAARPLLPMIGVPTTAGTGSEAQSYAVLSDAETREKMACGDPSAAFRHVILDPELTVTQPREVTAAAGFDAVAHAVETHVTTRRNPLSAVFSREAWQLLEANYERVLARPEDLEARAAMQLGAFFAGAAIENSMLGAAHACANPLTARYGTEHGAALAVLLPAVVRWNAGAAGALYDELLGASGQGRSGGASAGDGEALARRLEELREAGGMPRRLGDAGVRREDLPALAADAARQWTGTFNPRPFDEQGALEIYECAF
jgi:alcohol dehydrogenase